MFVECFPKNSSTLQILGGIDIIQNETIAVIPVIGAIIKEGSIQCTKNINRTAKHAFIFFLGIKYAFSLIFEIKLCFLKMIPITKENCDVPNNSNCVQVHETISSLNDTLSANRQRYAIKYIQPLPTNPNSELVFCIHL